MTERVNCCGGDAVTGRVSLVENWRTDRVVEKCGRESRVVVELGGLYTLSVLKLRHEFR